MGKKVKKKGRTAHKEKRGSASSLKNVPQQCNPSSETVADGNTVVKGREPCIHFNKGVDLGKISAKFGLPEPIRCEDCREGTIDRRGNRAKGKHGKKGGGSVDSKSESKAIWVCLECGHFACGGVGLPTTPQSHAVRHARLTRHPLVIQFENPHLRWCFPCKMVIPVDKMEANDMLLDIVKLVKGRSVKGPSVDGEDVWYGGGSVKNEKPPDNNLEIIPDNTLSGDLDERDSYVVRGLINIGNTCFFNSIMQNLLAMNNLRDYFLKLDGSIGPLTSAFRKLFDETSSGTGLRNVINPKSVFGCVCAKAPQFRGYQQQDSHELLRCLLDGLCTEELGARKRANSSQEDGISPNEAPTFVDTIFGGQISSTVCCVECGHSSTVYEPFLDLSLPVPTKKPPSRKTQPVSRPKKTKLPPKKAGRVRSKVNKDADSLAAQSVQHPSSDGDSSNQIQSSAPVTEKLVSSSGDSAGSDLVSPCAVADVKDSVSKNISTSEEFENKQVFENVTETKAAPSDDFTLLDCSDTFTWLDYLDPGAVSDVHNAASQNKDVSVIQDSGNQDNVQNDVLLQNASEFSSQVYPHKGEPNLKIDSCSANSWEEELPVQIQSSEVLLLPYKEEASTAVEITTGQVGPSVVSGSNEELLDFDGFGGLFDEPEAASGVNLQPLLGDNSFDANEVVGTGFINRNSSESDPDEVDNSNSMVSIDSCLTYFTKPELLSNEHAWHCENCSKILRDQRIKTRIDLPNTISKIQMNGSEDKIQNGPFGLCKDISPDEVKDIDNENVKNDGHNILGGLAPHDRTSDDDSKQNGLKLQTSQTVEVNPVVSQCEGGKSEMNYALPDLSHSSGTYKTCSQASLSDPASDSCSVHEPNSVGCNTGKQRNSQMLTGELESEEDEDKEMDSESVKVKRDATKRILINKAPPILTIHLKRFSQDARGRYNKLNGHVVFKDSIDLRPFMEPRCVEKGKYEYRLVGVVEHSGSIRMGHYVAYVRGGERSSGQAKKESGRGVWYYASDASVRETSLDEVLRCEAYILFYEKI